MLLALPLALLGTGICAAELLSDDSFTYPNGDLTGSSGSGWTGAWTGTNPVVVISPGLTFSDAIGNTLVTSGSALNTADGSGTTTISSREVADRDAETWISVLIQPQGGSTDFIGVSFYDNGLTTADARFAIEHVGGKDLRLVKRGGGLVNSATFTNPVGSTVFAVIHLVPGGGGGDPALDRLDVFFNPVLTAEPSVPHASIDIDGLQFDRVRIAAQNGRSSLVDELRIGETWADVSPFVPATDPDSDGDGLTDSREEEIGLDPFFPDTQFIAALKANAGLFGLRSTSEIHDVKLRGPFITVFGPDSADYSLDLVRKDGTVLDSFSEPIASPPPRLFLRLYLETP